MLAQESFLRDLSQNGSVLMRITHCVCTCALSAPNFSQLLRGFTSLTLNNINTGLFKVPASNNMLRCHHFKTKQNPCSFWTAGHSGCVAGRHVSSPGSQRIPFSSSLCSLLNVSHRSTRDFFKKFLIPHLLLKKQ